ncbi:MAG: acetylxylan esterase [Planctomycetota bacterium]|nr:MAG: acetylxylan esterase [Planctomycetota bacterium]
MNRLAPRLVEGLAVAAALLGSQDGSAQSVRRSHQSLDWTPTADGGERPLADLDDWRRRRNDILEQMQTVMGPLPAPASPVPLDPHVVEEVVEESFIRRKVTYHADSATATVAAWLLLPRDAAHAPQKFPAVLCLHQTVPEGKDEPAGLAGQPSLHYGRELAERGFVTLAPDYPSLGEHQHDFAGDDYQSGSMKAIYDNIRAIDYLQSLPQVDGRRIGAIGHSLGGHNAIFTAVLEPRLRAVVSSCGFTTFHKYYGGDLTGWSGPRYMPLIAERYGCDPDQMPFDFPELIAALAPRPFLAVAPLGDHNFEVSGVREVMAAARPIYELHNAANRLQALYPDAGHDFPLECRRAAYEFLEKSLSAPPPP